MIALKSKAFQQYRIHTQQSQDETHHQRLVRLYEAVDGSESKHIMLTEIFPELSEQQCYDEALYMKGEGWAVMHSTEHPYVSITHEGIKGTKAFLAPPSGNQLPDIQTNVSKMKKTLREWAGRERDTLALVFTDIVDSTNLGNAMGDEIWIGLLLEHFARARELMKQLDCFEIKIIGDSFMVAFRNAIDALDFVLNFHEDTGHETIKIRAGIHVGPVRIIENDIFGLMVNYTKRIESLAEKDGIILSNEAKTHISYEKASRHSMLRFIPNEVELKGFDEPQKIWRVARVEVKEMIDELNSNL